MSSVSSVSPCCLFCLFFCLSCISCISPRTDYYPHARRFEARAENGKMGKWRKCFASPSHYCTKYSLPPPTIQPDYCTSPLALTPADYPTRPCQIQFAIPPLRRSLAFHAFQPLLVPCKTNNLNNKLYYYPVYLSSILQKPHILSL